MANWGKCDFKQFERLAKKMEKLRQKDMDAFCEAAAKELTARLLAKVIKRTPVGKKPKLEGAKTVKLEGKHGKRKSFLTAEGARREKYWSGYQGGTLRRGWTGGTQQDPVSYAQSLPIKRVGNGYVIDVINPVEWASYVEFGHRQRVGRYVPALGKSLKSPWVKGKFMLTKSEIELSEQAPQVLEKKLMKYLGGVFDD